MIAQGKMQWRRGFDPLREWRDTVKRDPSSPSRTIRGTNTALRSFGSGPANPSGICDVRTPVDSSGLPKPEMTILVGMVTFGGFLVGGEMGCGWGSQDELWKTPESRERNSSPLPRRTIRDAECAQKPQGCDTRLSAKHLRCATRLRWTLARIPRSRAPTLRGSEEQVKVGLLRSE